jgi:hypothetical protein
LAQVKTTGTDLHRAKLPSNNSSDSTPSIHYRGGNEGRVLTAALAKVWLFPKTKRKLGGGARPGTLASGSATSRSSRIPDFATDFSRRLVERLRIYDSDKKNKKKLDGG